jgi:hypothetical protein
MDGTLRTVRDRTADLITISLSASTVLRRNAKRISHPGELPPHRQVFDVGFGNVGSIPTAAAKWELLSGAASLQGNYSFNRFLTFTSIRRMETSNTQAAGANLRLRYNYYWPDSDL